MPTSVLKIDATAVDVTVTDDRLTVTLADGRELAVPLSWFPRLSEATEAQRRNWRFIGRGQGYPLAGRRRGRFGCQPAAGGVKTRRRR
jgi:hypothetical protein